jgi:Ca2+-dependent lipid-binding protein
LKHVVFDICCRGKSVLKLRVVSGHCFPRPDGSNKGEVIDPYVVVLVHGVEDDYVKHKTEVVRNNGFNPTWNQSFECVLSVPDQAVVLFTVKDFSTSGANEIIGTYALPVMAIGKGEVASLPDVLFFWDCGCER